MSSGYQEPGGGTSSPSSGTAVGSKPIRALLKVLRNIDVTAEPDFGSNFIPRIKTPLEILGTALRIQNPAQTFYTNLESAALLTNQSIKIPIITTTESGNKKDEVVLLKQAQSLEGKTFPTYFDVIETAAPANPAAGVKRIYVNSTTHELTQRSNTGTEVKMSDGSGGGGGAPTNVPYLTLANDGTLTVERVLTASGRVSITDAGANSTATLDVVAGSIVDSQIGSHTSTKISITSKGQLNSAIVYSDQNNALGSNYVDITERAAPSNPSAGTLRIYANSTSHELTQRDSAGVEKKFSDGSGGGGAPTTSQYLTLAADGSLSAERVLTASTRVTITDAGANSTATLDVGSGSIVDAYIGTHTSTKISITAKGQLNSQIAYKDENNWITNSHVADNTLNWAKVLKTGSIFDDLGDVTITTAAAQDLIQRNSGNTAWVNLVKGSNNTLLGINGSGVLAYTTVTDANIASHTSTKITITTKGQLNSAILYSDVDNALGAHYVDVTEQAAPANPGAGVLRIYANSTTHELTQRDSAGVEKKFSDGSGGAGAPTTSQYLTLASDGSLSAERVLTASTRVTITDAGANSTATLDVGSGSIVDAYIGSHTSTKISITAKGQLNSAIVYNDQTNTFGDFDQIFRDNRLRINNPADTFAYTIIAAAIGANRNLTLPLLTGNDTVVAEAFTQTLTNKTIDFSSNTGSNIGDSAIGTHTSTKITITTKGQLNSSIAYVDQANVFSDNDQSFRSNRLRIANPANTFFYSFTAAAIAASRVITLPLLTSGDTMVTEAFAATLTNKTMSGASNTFSNLGDSAISAHTSTKITITTKGQLNSAIVYTDQANTFGANNQTIPIANLLLSNNGNTGAFGVQASLTGSRTWALPNANTQLIGNDTTHTLTNKTYDATGTGNSLSNVGDASIASHTSTKISITAKGQLNSQILYGDQNNVIGGNYIEITEMAAPASPAAGKLRLWADSTSHEWSQKNSSGTVVKMSDGSGGGGITASSTDTLTNKTINATNNTVIYAGSYTYTVYRITGGGTIYARNNKTGAVTSNVNLDPLITTILASGDPSFEVLPGFYDLSSGFSGWNAVSHMEAFFHTSSIINVPNAFTGVVWKFNPTDTVIWHASIEGGLWDEQGSQANNWTFLQFAPVSTNPPTTTGAVYDCRFKNIEVWNCDKVSHFKTTNKSWVTQNYFEHIYGEGMKYLFYGEHVGTYTANQSGMQENKFVDVSCQATAAGSGHAQVLGGFIGIFGQRNMFIGCTPWDVAAANASASTGTITTNASDNIIIGGLITSYQFSDTSTGGQTMINDSFQGFKHSRAEFTYNDPNPLIVYRPSTTTFDELSIQFDQKSSTGVRRTFGKLAVGDDDRTNGAEYTWWGVHYMINGALALRGAFYNNGLFFGPTTGTRVFIDNTGISGSNKTFTFPNLSGQLATINATQTLTNKTLTTPIISTISNTGTITLPTSTDTLVGKATTDNLTNKTMHGTNWRVTAKSSDVTLAADESIVPVDASGANRTITLPGASSSTNKIYIISKSDSSTNTVTIDGASSETINGALTFVLTQQYQSVMIWCNGTAWFTQPNSTERTGEATGTANGSTTVFNINHGLGATPSSVFVACSTHAVAFTYTKSSTQIVVTFTSAPAASPATIKFDWRAVV